MAYGNVNCPIHGTHGALSQGKCWYCVQSGVTPVPPRPTKSKFSQVVKSGTKRKIA